MLVRLPRQETTVTNLIPHLTQEAHLCQLLLEGLEVITVATILVLVMG